MQVASIFFVISLAGLIGMLSAKLVSMKNGQPGPLWFLSRFDAPLGMFLTRFSAFVKVSFIILWQRTASFAEQSHHFIVSLLHSFVQTVERRVRAWREFARERKIERRDASEYIQDVVEYKKELKQNGHTQNSHDA